MIMKLFCKDGKLIEGLKLITHEVLYDERGFCRKLNKLKFEKYWDSLNFQLNQSRSLKGVLRGLHFQLEPESQGKLVKCLSGKIFDAVVDIRSKSKTFASWVGVKLSEEKHQSLWVPPDLLMVFTLSDYADIQYLVTKNGTKIERCIVWNDEDIGVIGLLNDQPLISAKDASGMTLSKANLSGNILNESTFNWFEWSTRRCYKKLHTKWY